MPKFSADNYGDITVKGKKDGTTNNKKATRIRRTTVFARTLRTLSDTQWNNMIVTARTYFLKTNKVSKSRVCAVSTTTLVKRRKVRTGTSLWSWHEYSIAAFSYLTFIC